MDWAAGRKLTASTATPLELIATLPRSVEPSVKST